MELSNLELRTILWWALFLGYAGVIFWLSDGPPPQGVPFIKLPGADRAYHFLEYGLLSFLGLQAISPKTQRRFLSVLLLCWLYGLVDEVHQSWVPGRSADILDWVIDGGGIVTVGWLWGRWRRSHLRDC